MDLNGNQAVTSIQTFADVETLVLQLYSKDTPPYQLFEIQNQIQQLQKSDHGWELADALMGSAHSSVRFMGALTFSVRLNSVSRVALEENRLVIENRLLHWIVTCQNNGDKAVVRKLTTALALLYIYTLHDLNLALSKLLFAAMQLNASVSASSNIRTVKKHEILLISQEVFTMALWFIDSIAEEASKVMSTLTPEQYSRLIEQYEELAQDILYLINLAFNEYARVSNQNQYSPCASAAMKALSTTASFCFNHCPAKDGLLSSLRTTLTTAIEWCIESRDPEPLEELVDMLDSSPRVFGPAQSGKLLDLIKSPWGSEQLNEVYQSGEIGEDKVVLLLLTYSIEKMQDIIDRLRIPAEQDAAKYVLDLMLRLLQCEGYPAIEDEAATRALDFWNAFAEEIACYTDDPEDSLVVIAKDYIERAINSVWIKIRLPPENIWNELGKDTKKEFGDFRNQSKDLLGSSYEILGSRLVRNFGQRIPDFNAEERWYELEGTLFCLVALDFAGDQENDPVLAGLLETSFLDKLAASENAPKRVRRTTVDLIGKCAGFFQRNSKYLAVALNFLFTNLHQTGAPDEASPAIYSLCSSCRKELVGELPTFFQQFDVFIQHPSATEFSVDKVSGALACLLQALPSLDDTIDGARKLVDYVYRGVNQAKEQVQAGEFAHGHAIATMAMHCLSSIARGLQAPGIDLDEPVPVTSEETLQKIAFFQSDVFSIIISTLQTFGNNRAVIDEICSVFKNGFTESASSPFHFAPLYVMQLVSSTTIDTPDLESLLGMTCGFLRSQERQSGPPDAAIGQVLQHVLGLIQARPDPRGDPEVAHALIGVLFRCVPHYIDLVLHIEPTALVKTMFEFCIKAIELPEPLPKREALSFWQAFLQMSSHPAQSQAILDEVVVTYGQALANAFVHQVSGEASRVDLEFFNNPIKKLYTRHVLAKSWFENALVKVPTSKADDATKRKFLLQLGIAHSNRASKEVLTGFWSHCNGMSSNYKPLG